MQITREQLLNMLYAEVSNMDDLELVRLVLMSRCIASGPSFDDLMGQLGSEIAGKEN